MISEFCFLTHNTCKKMMLRTCEKAEKHAEMHCGVEHLTVWDVLKCWLNDTLWPPGTRRRPVPRWL